MSNSIPSPTHAAGARHSEKEIRRRIEGCPKLASLHSVNQELNRLARSDMSLTSQIAEIIQRDPSLSQRLLRMVNSVYFGLSARINNIEEAVFFLGLRQIREFSVATPVIEEMEQLQAFSPSPTQWKNLWSHSIGTAILTREILSSTQYAVDDDTDYLVGLLHNVGKIVMAYAFPEELNAVANTPVRTPAEVCALERDLIGWDHAEIGAYFLECHNLVEELSFSVRYHHDPKNAPCHQTFAAAVQVADYLVRHATIESGFERVDPIAPDAWVQLDGWQILYGSDDNEARLSRASLANALARLPAMLNGLL
jgi:HD-like signal output (HDOD) protein